MARFDSYPNKQTPDDSDTLLIHDTSGSANKQVLLSGIFNWLKSKLTSSSVDGLDTESDTIIGAINEVHGDVDGVVTGITTAQNSVSTINSKLGSETLTTTAQTVTGAINEVDAAVDTANTNIATNATNISTNATEIGNIKADLESDEAVAARYYAVIDAQFTDYTQYDYTSIQSTDYPTGWQTGYYDASTGVHKSSNMFICTADYIPVSDIVVKVTPTHNKCVAVHLYDAEYNFLGMVGNANSTKHPENINVEVVANVASASYITITAGRYPNTASQLIQDADFISTIGFYGGTSAVGRIEALETEINDVQTDIDTLYDLLERENVETYTATEAEDVISRIRALQTGNTLTFAMVTDIHYGSTDTTYGLNTETQPYMLDHTIANINYVAKYVKYDFLVNLGDNTDGDMEPTTQNETDDLVNKKLGLLGIPYLYTGGNHDTEIYYNSGSDIRTPAEMYAYLYSLMRGVTARSGAYGNDWYLDLDNLGIRIIGLTANYGYRYRFSGNSALSTWLESVLDSTKINLILTHLSPINTQNWNGTAPNNSAYARGPIQTFVDNGGTVIQLCGHSHADYSFESPWLCVFSNCTKFYQADLTDSHWSAVTGYDSLGIVNPARVSGEASEDCWTTVILNPEERRIDFVRFGAGNDRSYTF